MKKIYVLFLLALLPLVASAVVKRTINVSKAGTLSSYITEDEKYQIEKLTLTGEINGEDIGFLREMARGFRSCEDGEMLRGSSIGSLSVLDMSGVKIVAGGEFFSVFWDGSELYMKYELERNDEIPPMAFWNCKALTSISIPNSVTFIGGSAFSSCPNLASITIPSSVTSIGPSAFYGTPWYNNQPDGVVYAGKVLYSYKGTIPEGEKININKGIYSITGGAFSNCSGLTSVTIPSSVTSIGSSAFQNCGLTSLAIPSSVTSIGSDAFLGTPWYDNQSDGVVYAGKVLYKYKGTIPDGTKISIKKGTLGIAGGAFSGCTGLTSVTIPSSVTTIGGGAFTNCSGLTSITIPSSVTSIGYAAFSGCTGLTSVTIPNSVTSFDGAFSGCSGLTSINIPNSVTSIGGSTFANCKVLSSINIPSSVTIIGQCAFSGCSGLTSITIPNSLTFIGYQAFRNCSGMKSVTIPNSVTSVSEEVFYGCSGLTSVTIPNNVRSIRRSAFQRCI